MRFIMGTRRNIAVNTLARWTGEVIGKALMFTLYVFLARALGDVGFGHYSYAMAFGAMAAMFIDMGTSIYLVKAISGNQSIEHYLSNIVAMKTAVMLFVVPVVSVMAYLIADKPGVVMVFLVAQLMIVYLDPVSSVFRAKKQMYYETVVMLCWRIMMFAFALLVVYYLEGSLYFIAAAYTMAALLAVFIAARMLKRFYGVRYWKPSEFCLASWKKIFLNSVPAGIMIFLHGIVFKVNLLFLEHFQNPQQVGWYSSSYRLIEGTFFVSSFFVAALFPYFCEFADKKGLTDRGRKTFRDSLALIFGGSIVISLFFYLFSTPLITLIFGQEFLPGADSLQILAGSLFFIYANELLIFTFISLGIHRKVLAALCVNLLIHVVVCNLAVPHYGYMGAAWSFVIAQITLFVIYFLIYYNVIRSNPGKEQVN